MILTEKSKNAALLSIKIEKYEYLTGEEILFYILLSVKQSKNKQQQLKIMEENKQIQFCIKQKTSGCKLKKMIEKVIVKKYLKN